jgi:hypothetical protein
MQINGQTIGIVRYEHDLTTSLRISVADCSGRSFTERNQLGFGPTDGSGAPSRDGAGEAFPQCAPQELVGPWGFRQTIDTVLT